jgi:hypothetical protein
MTIQIFAKSSQNYFAEVQSTLLLSSEWVSTKAKVAIDILITKLPKEMLKLLPRFYVIVTYTLSLET